jgi:hypothetical protein
MFNIKKSIKYNNPIDDKLHVIGVVSNCCQYNIRYKLAKEFINRMNQEEHVILYFVELVYDNSEFVLTESDNPRHLQLKTIYPLWHKENLINIAIEKLLPKDWKAVAWIDTDLEFENPNWGLDTLKLLNDSDVVQLFSHCIFMDSSGNTDRINQGIAYQHYNNMITNIINKNGISSNHPGYAWACKRSFYDNIEKIFDFAIIGGGDSFFANALFGLEDKIIKFSTIYDKIYMNYYNKIQNLHPIIAYIPNIIKHYYHGSIQDRQYIIRYKILIDNFYNPNIDLTYDDNGILIPTDKCSKKMLNQIIEYFFKRNEDVNSSQFNTIITNNKKLLHYINRQTNISFSNNNYVEKSTKINNTLSEKSKIFSYTNLNNKTDSDNNKTDSNNKTYSNNNKTDSNNKIDLGSKKLEKQSFTNETNNIKKKSNTIENNNLSTNDELLDYTKIVTKPLPIKAIAKKITVSNNNNNIVKTKTKKVNKPKIIELIIETPPPEPKVSKPIKVINNTKININLSKYSKKI